MQSIRVERQIGGRTLAIETGTFAKLADGAVTVQYGDTVVFRAVVRANPREGIDFLDEPRTPDTAPLVGSRVWAALVLGCAPDRLGSGFRPLAARIIEWNSRVVAQGRLTWILIIPYDPFPGKIGLGERPSTEQ